MPSVRYALVAYLKSPITGFVETLRRELHPSLPHLAAHLTLLPPRPLHGSESEALHILEQICGGVEPFELTLGEMQSFAPTTPTVYIGVGQGASRMEELHLQLNRQILAFSEEWPYVPHLTIAKMNNEREAAHAVEIARQCWRGYAGSRRILLDQLTFVREDAPNQWVDLAPLPLGGSLVSH
jgi:2'-5' RNA ligase